MYDVRLPIMDEVSQPIVQVTQCWKVRSDMCGEDMPACGMESEGEGK